MVSGRSPSRMVFLVLRPSYFTEYVPVPNCGNCSRTPSVTAFTCGRSRIAMASSRVSSLRVSISVVGRPKVNTSMWNAKMMSEPMSFTMFSTLEFRPRTTDEIRITIMTPMTMPSTVRPERILFLAMVSSAMRRISL